LLVKKKLEVPKSSIRDYLDKATRIGIASADSLIALSSGISVPLSGPLLEFYNAFVQSPQQTRLLVLLEEIIEKLSELEANSIVTLENLQNNDLFHSILIEATIVARKTHNQQKRNMLKNAVVNSVTNTSINDDFAALFVRYIDELTISHISLLEKMHSSANELQKIEKFEELYESLVSTKENKDTFKFLCEDLILRGLVRISQGILNPNDLYETDGETFEKEGEDNRPKVKITELGNEFLKFVLA
jgi:hypothetical protein